MLRGGMRYFCVCPGTVQRGIDVSVHRRYPVARSLSSMVSTSNSYIAISSSWCRPATKVAAAAVPCRLIGFPSSLFIIRHGSNYGVLRLWSSGRTSRDSKETVPLTEEEPTSTSLTPIKIEEDVEKKWKQQPMEQVPQQSWRQRAKTFAIEYGRVGICTHIVLSLLSFSIIYVGVSSGVDVKAVLDSVGISTSTTTSSAGSVLIAYTLYKVLVPIRWALTFAVTPVVLRALRRRGYMLATTNSPSSPPPPPQ
ncbi:unnamed protein product [Peronospora farinosa]|uniref:DUF1279 domain-containing protein n=1 Tax=Peronospora farinosa TaxID=134698 RepID=A0AAV0TE07_9STRA|nr:unnamed protein product [Peronospora farinosa]CAI5719181.1 unnamed protein product [Peronospora farinosa]